ncbi:MAG: HAD family hydrolase [Chloroflexi bacterium]|nr:HAD family hydrolase [Chloroflexota bacterium]
MAKVLLFDIDNTLLWSGGAGGKAMRQAFNELFGIDDGFARVEFSGRTDTAIVREAFRLHGIDGDHHELLVRFSGRYHQLLPESLRTTKGRLMPGIPDLLAALQRRDDVTLGIATGNFRRGAQLKLRHYGLDGYFGDGGFGDDHEDRDVLVRMAIERVAGGADRAEVMVIGDTPLDVASARANEAQPVAVATGKHGVEELEAAGADIVFPDFSDWSSAVATLLR